MSEPRTRDRVWQITLQNTIIMDDTVTPHDIAEDADVSLRTAREALITISYGPFVNRHVAKDGSVEYRKSDLVDFDG